MTLTGVDPEFKAALRVVRRAERELDEEERAERRARRLRRLDEE